MYFQVVLYAHDCSCNNIIINTSIMKSTKVQTLGRICWKYWNIWIENTFACICIIVLGIYRTSFQHNLHCFINACVHVVNDYSVINLYNHSIIIMYIYTMQELGNEAK